MVRIDFRQILNDRLGRRGGGRKAARPPAARWLETAQRASRALRALLFPLLAPGERLQMQQAALRGITQYLRQVNRILAGPRFQALRESAQGAAELAEIHGQLLRLVAVAAELSERAEETRRGAQAELKEVIDRLLEVADGLTAQTALPAPERQAAERFSAFVRSFRARAAGQAEDLRARSLRKVDRARSKADEARRDRELRRLEAELRGDAAGAFLPAARDEAPPAAPPRRRRAADEADVAAAGAPLERCLTAPVAEYAGLADVLDEHLGQLGPREADGAAPERVDMLVEGDLAILLLGLLDGVPFIAVEAGTSREALEELLAEDEACGRAAAVAAQLLRGARDGALVAAQLVMLLKEQAAAWLEAEGDDEALALREELLAADEVLARSQEEKEAVLLRAERRIAEIDAEIETERRAAAAEETLRAVEAGKPVRPEELEAAVALRRGATPAATQPAAARRPRARKR